MYFFCLFVCKVVSIFFSYSWVELLLPEYCNVQFYGHKQVPEGLNPEPRFELLASYSLGGDSL